MLAGGDLDAVAGQLVGDVAAEVRVDGGQHGRELLDEGDVQAAVGERVGHLGADVARADDHRRPHLAGEQLVDGEAVVHGVQHVHAGQVDALRRRPHGGRAGADHQPVIAQRQPSAGDPVLPSGFAFGWNRAVNPEFASEIAYHFDPIEGAAEVADGSATELSGVVADDEAMALTVTLAYPFAEFGGVVSHPVFSPMPEALMADLDDQTQWEADVMIGNGPFVMAEPWTHEVSVVLERNEDYYGGLTGELAVLDGVEFTISADVDSAYSDFEAGNGQTGFIPADRFAEATAAYANATEPNLGLYHFINQESQLGGEENLKLRQAISLAIDREAINETVYSGARLLPSGLTPPGVPGFAEGLCGEWCTYDPERAQELVDEWAAEGGSLDAPITITINFNSGSGHEDVETLMQANLATIGLDSQLDGRDPTTYFSQMREGACELCRAGWIWDYPVYDNA